ncbi:MAG: M14 family zinc carboxypeptidase [Bacteroidota bacterium]
MNRILLTFALLATLWCSAQEVQELYQRAKISYNQIEDLGRLADLDIPVEHGIHKKGFYIISEFSISELDRARQNGFQVDVLISDAKAHFLAENAKGITNQPFNPGCEDGNDYTTPVNFELGSMGGYLTYQELLNELDEMAALYPNLITSKENISNFITEGEPDNSTTPPIGGNGIKWVKISDNPNSSTEGEPQILYTALHHAREPAGLSQLVFYMWYLLENYDTDPEVQSILDNTELYFVPVINPDGYLYNEKTDPNGGGFWRKNRKDGHGTDLNRNYDYYINGDPSMGIWGGTGSSSDTGSNIYHGPAPFSEIEVQAMKWFVENHNFLMAFNNHTSGNLLLFPFGYTDTLATDEDALFDGVSEELVSRNGFSNMQASDLYPASGYSDDFMYGTVNTHDKIYTFTPEIGPSFWPPSNQIESISKSMMYLNLTSSKMVNNYAAINDTAPQYVGEAATADATFDIQRLGVSGSGSFTVSLNAVSPNITSVGAPVSFTSMDILDTDNGVISYSIAGGTEAGDELVYELIVNNGTYNSTYIVTKRFGALNAIFTDPGNSTTENFDNNGWDTTTDTFVSGPSSITDSDGDDYPNNTNETITLSNAINLAGATGANVTFYAKWEIENNFDYVQFEVSIDDGNNWIPQCGLYTNVGVANTIQPEGEPLYDGIQNEWILEQIDLSDYLEETILVRFQLASDNGSRADGFYFDDLQINVVGDVVLDNNNAEVSQFRVYPNPVSDELNINTHLENYNIELYTIQGQLVNRIQNNSGARSLDYSGLSSGIYLLRLTSAEVSQTIRIVKR